MHHAVNLLVVWLHVQPENGPSCVHAFHVESQKLRRAAFFHPPPHELGDPFFLLRHSLAHRVSPLSIEPSQALLLSPPRLFFTPLLFTFYFSLICFFTSMLFLILSSH